MTTNRLSVAGLAITIGQVFLLFPLDAHAFLAVRLIMDLLAFKLVVTPLLLLAATLAVRHWGEKIGGVLLGLPLTSGPVSVFLALEHGPAFAAQATSGSLVATAAQAGFCLVYSCTARRGWVVSLTSACAAFAVIAGLLQPLPLQSIGLFPLAILAVAIALGLAPDTVVRGGKLAPPRWDLPLRMVLMAALVVGVTFVAPYVGPKASGVLASFPFMAIILAVFTHRLLGYAATQQLMRGMMTGLLSFAAFALMLSLTLTRMPLIAAYSAAILCTLAIQAVSLYRMRVPVAVPAE